MADVRAIDDFECIACGACEPECPREAIFYAGDVPAEFGGPQSGSSYVIVPDICVGDWACADVCPVNIISLIPSEEMGGLPGGTALMLDEELCIRCALCIDRCPPKALSMGMWTGVGVPVGIPLTIGGLA